MAGNSLKFNRSPRKSPEFLGAYTEEATYWGKDKGPYIVVKDGKKKEFKSAGDEKNFFEEFKSSNTEICQYIGTFESHNRHVTLLAVDVPDHSRKTFNRIYRVIDPGKFEFDLKPSLGMRFALVSKGMEKSELDDIATYKRQLEIKFPDIMKYALNLSGAEKCLLPEYGDVGIALGKNFASLSQYRQAWQTLIIEHPDYAPGSKKYAYSTQRYWYKDIHTIKKNEVSGVIKEVLPGIVYLGNNGVVVGIDSHWLKKGKVFSRKEIQYVYVPFDKSNITVLVSQKNMPQEPLNMQTRLAFINGVGTDENNMEMELAIQKNFQSYLIAAEGRQKSKVLLVQQRVNKML